MATTTSSVYSHITKNAKIRCGKPCIEGTRVAVEDIVFYFHRGYAASGLGRELDRGCRGPFLSDDLLGEKASRPGEHRHFCGQLRKARGRRRTLLLSHPFPEPLMIRMQTDITPDGKRFLTIKNPIFPPGPQVYPVSEERAIHAGGTQRVGFCPPCSLVPKEGPRSSSV